MESPDTRDHSNLLDCKIQMARSSVQSFSVSPILRIQPGHLAFREASPTRTAISSVAPSFSGWVSMHLPRPRETIGAEKNKQLLNTLEFGVSANLTFPQFLIPLRQEKLPKSFKPKTIINLGYNFQKRRITTAILPMSHSGTHGTRAKRSSIFSIRQRCFC